MSAAVRIRNIIRKAEDAFVISVVVLQRNFDSDQIIFIILIRDFFAVNRFFMQNTFIFVEMRNEFGNAPFVIKIVLFLFVAAFINQADTDAFVEKSLLPQPF